MNLFRFVDKYGDNTFDDIPFCEVDNGVFAVLSYIDMDGLISNNRFRKRTIKEVGDEYFETRYSKKERKNILPVRQAIKLLRYIKDTKRYGNLLLYNYEYEVSEEQQFSAVTIEINPKLVYVSFEGTDHLISGWKEDFMLSYQFPILSQKKAIDYVNNHFLFNFQKIILGGHSKGGNLAMVAGMYSIFFIRNRIIQIYNNDGPGLLLEQFNSKNYLKIQNRLIHIVPNYTIIGLLLRHSNNFIVVRSARKGIYSHDLFTWIVNDKSFERTELTLFSKTFDEGLIEWLNKYDKEKRKEFVYSLFDVFERANITSVIDIFENKKLILSLVSEMREIDSSTKDILRDFMSYLLKCFKDVKIEELKSLFEKNVK